MKKTTSANLRKYKSVFMLPVLWIIYPLYAITQPVNDDFDQAIVIDDLPFFYFQNTTDATTDFDDPDCFGQGPTVWYAFVPEADIRLEANTFGSNYDTALSVYIGSRGDLYLIDCNDDAGNSLQSRVIFDAYEGETYYFMVSAYGSGPGGELSFSLDEASPPPPPLTFGLDIQPTGKFDRGGNAIISGTVSCSRFMFVDIYGELRQHVGRLNTISGDYYSFFPCEGDTYWEVMVSSYNGKYAGGHATVSANAFAYDPDTFEFGYESTSVVIRMQGSR